jgi:uncharacterized membrane protein (UPF0127 family)
MEVREADTAWRRLRGFLGYARPPGFALRFAPCRSVHTFGMRFALDLVWLGEEGAVLRVDRGVPPWRVRACRRASAVVEVPSGYPRPQCPP